MIYNFQTNTLTDNMENRENDFERDVLKFIEDWRTDSQYVTVKTSGSTGTPKIFEVEKSKMVNSARMTCDFLGLKEGDTALLCLPVDYISGKMMVVRSMVSMLKLDIIEPSLKPLDNLAKPVDFCAMTPLQVENSLDKIYLVKNLIIGGAAVSEALKKKIFKIFEEKEGLDKNRIFETFGMSETLSHIALKEIYPKNEDFFTVMDGVEISRDERGCLNILAPKLNSKTLKTNDLVEIKNDRQFRFLGRIDNVINSGGAKIFPEELESLAKKIIENEIVFLGVPDEVLGERLVAVVESMDDESLKQKILNLNYQKTFHKPKEIIFKEKIPRTPNGKVNRMALKSEILKQ